MLKPSFPTTLGLKVVQIKKHCQGLQQVKSTQSLIITSLAKMSTFKIVSKFSANEKPTPD